MEEEIQTEEQDIELPPPDEVDEPAPSAEQEKLWTLIDQRLTPSSILEEAKLLELDEEKLKQLSSISLSSNIKKVVRECAIPEDGAGLLVAFIRRFAVHDLTLGSFTKELSRAFGEEKSTILMENDTLHEILQAWSGDAILFERPGKEKSLPKSSLGEKLPAATSSAPQRPLTPPTPAIKREPDQTEEASKPFILHEEKPAVSAQAPGIQPSINFDILRAPRKAPLPKPVTARIESPFDEKKEQPKRIVHYSNLRTPVDKS